MVSLVELIILLLSILILLVIPLAVVIRKWMLRDHVWLTIDTKAGNRTVRLHAKPEKNNEIETPWGPFLITADDFTRVNPGLMAPKNVPLYRYVEDVRTPINLRNIIATNPGVQHLAESLNRAILDTRTLAHNNWIRMMFGKSDYLLIIVLMIVAGVIGGLLGYGFRVK